MGPGSVPAMKVVILGGTGVFGSRLARLLVRDGHDVTLAARSDASALAAEIGARALRHNRDEDPAPLFADRPDLLVDATGPFQAYRADPYRIAHAAIAAGVNYADLSDDAEFTLGISELNAQAREAGLFALSGLSTVPALSGSVVAALSAGFDEVLSIDAALLPGNRAPRGRAVMAAILGQVGRPMLVMSGGAWEARRGWSEAKIFELPGGGKRRAYLNKVPDLQAFPDHFGAKTVMFRAGLELGIMGHALAALSWLRRFVWVPFPVGAALVGARMLEPFGTDRGGMVVSITGVAAGQVTERSWRLLAQKGDGPYVPAIPVRALVAAGGAPAGARPALEDVPLSSMETAMADLNITTAKHEAPSDPLFADVLGDDFQVLPRSVQKSHAAHPVIRLSGQAKVTRGGGLWPNIIAAAFGFPPEGEDYPVTVTKTRAGDCETWVREFGAKTFRSVLRKTQNGMTERFGPFTFSLGLHVADGALHFPVVGGRLGPFPLPRFALPQSITQEFDDNGTMRFDVTLRAPMTGAFIVRYEGGLTPMA